MPLHASILLHWWHCHHGSSTASWSCLPDVIWPAISSLVSMGICIIRSVCTARARTQRCTYCSSIGYLDRSHPYTAIRTHQHLHLPDGPDGIRDRDRLHAPLRPGRWRRRPGGHCTHPATTHSSLYGAARFGLAGGDPIPIPEPLGTVPRTAPREVVRSDC